MSKLQVDQKRWEEAQAWEYQEWEGIQRGGRVRRFLAALGMDFIASVKNFDDWNYWWEGHFDSYKFLPKDLGELIELGCGPYTNTRVILKDRSASRVTLSDPLVQRYAGFRHGWLASQYRARRVLLDDHTIEECPFKDGQFDTVILNNVLDHVRDAGLCLREAARITKPGGYFIFGQELTNADDEAHHAGHAEDIGHPIAFSLEDVEPFLAPFEAVVKKVLPREAGRAPEHHYATLIFAGKKKG